MSNEIQATIDRFLSGVRLGAAQHCRRVSTFPLFAENGEGPVYLTLGEALAGQLLEVQELHEGGSVPQLAAVNAADVPVLILDGEELVGAKQNRSLNATVLLAPRSKTVIPVSCTEAGRWRFTSRRFADSGEMVPHAVRARKMRTVSLSLKDGRHYASDQGEVWCSIDEVASSLGRRSATSSMRDVLEQERATLDEFAAAFPLCEGQRGLLVAVDGKFVSLDWVSRPEAWARLHGRVVRSHALHGHGAPESDRAGSNAAVPNTAGPGAGVPAAAGPSATVPDDEAAAAFLKRAASAGLEARPSVGLGTDVRLEGKELLGAGLVCDEAVVHLYLVGDQGRGRPQRGGGHERLERLRRLRRQPRLDLDCIGDRGSALDEPAGGFMIDEPDGGFMIDGPGSGYGIPTRDGGARARGSDVFTYDLVGGLVVADVGGRRMLVDTGAPASVGRGGPLRVAGVEVPLSPAFLGTVTPESIGEMLGTRVDGLIGMDLLGRTPFAIDPRTRTVAFGAAARWRGGARLPVRLAMTAPIVRLEVAGRPLSLVLDTGSTHHFLTAARTEGLAPDAEPLEDFYPLLGRFQSPAFTLPLRVGGEERPERFGQLPAALNLLLGLLPGVDGLAGAGLLRRGALACDFARGEIALDASAARDYSRNTW